MVSAGNSFGLMDGGVDAAIVKYFGPQLMERVQHKILTEYLGEQNLGSSFIIETKHHIHPFLAHTPTMRVPQNMSGHDTVYRAMWAMLLAVHKHNQSKPEKLIKIIACPGLGTLTAGVEPEDASRQMSLAYKHFLSAVANAESIKNFDVDKTKLELKQRIDDIKKACQEDLSVTVVKPMVETK